MASRLKYPVNAEWCDRGYVAGFVHYAAAPYYQGKWATAYLSEDLPNFVYYDWMGDKVSAPRLAEREERIKEGYPQTLGGVPGPT